MGTRQLLCYIEIVLLVAGVVDAYDENHEAAYGKENACDIQGPEFVYCYCDSLDLQSAEEANCWIFNSDSNFENYWEIFDSQRNLRRVTYHLRPDGSLNPLPTRIFELLPKLEEFGVEYATIETIHSFTFGNSTALSTVSLKRNSISTLQEYAIAYLPSLETLDLSQNEMAVVKKRAFYDLPKLMTLQLNQNSIDSIEFEAFQSLQNLKSLELFSNKIMTINPRTFKGLAKLESLDLHQNHLEYIGDMTFQDLHSLIDLNLEQNYLKYFSAKSLIGLTQLNNLNLKNNKLLSLGPEVFQTTPNIRRLDIRDNLFVTLNYQTIQPFVENQDNQTISILHEGNNFRCDTRLLWLFGQMNTTQSESLRRISDSLVCYMEAGTPLSPQLEDEMDSLDDGHTFGIGPWSNFSHLMASDLPEPRLCSRQIVTELSLDKLLEKVTVNIALLEEESEEEHQDVREEEAEGSPAQDGTVPQVSDSKITKEGLEEEGDVVSPVPF